MFYVLLMYINFGIVYFFIISIVLLLPINFNNSYADTIIGTNEDDDLEGTLENDDIFGLLGNDRIAGEFLTNFQNNINDLGDDQIIANGGDDITAGDILNNIQS